MITDAQKLQLRLLGYDVIWHQGLVSTFKGMLNGSYVECTACLEQETTWERLWQHKEVSTYQGVVEKMYANR